MHNSLSSLIVKNLQINTKNIISVKNNNKWIWKDSNYLIQSISYCRDFLKSENIEKGDRVAYKGSNSVEWIAWNMACNSLGAIWVPMYDNQNQEYCNHIVNDCSPKLFITNPDTISNAKYKLNTKMINNNIEQSSNNQDYSFINNDISTLIYTSGTTGKPKGVMLSNENIITNINGINERYPDFKNKLSLNILPWAHIYSQTCELYYNILNDNKIAICSSREEFIQELKEIQPDVLYVVPRVLELIKSKVEFLNKPIIQYILPVVLKRVFGKNLKTIFVGGAKLQTTTRDFFQTNGYSICEGYGCTELSPIVSINHYENPRNEDSIGKVLDNVIVEIIEEEIQVSGPNVMKGYWNNPDETNKVLIERDNKIWYKTGDSGYLDNDFLFYSGRINDNYKLSNGKFVNIEEIESIVKHHVKCNCIVFTRDNINNELIVSKEINENTLNNINKELNNYLKIKKTHLLEENKWEEYYTPKMSIKRKNLIHDFLNNKIE